MHYGVLGQKWGVRRYQPYPKDYKGSGTFTGKEKRAMKRDIARTRVNTERAAAAKYKTNRGYESLAKKQAKYQKGTEAHKLYTQKLKAAKRESDFWDREYGATSQSLLDKSTAYSKATGKSAGRVYNNNTAGVKQAAGKSYSRGMVGGQILAGIPGASAVGLVNSAVNKRWAENVRSAGSIKAMEKLEAKRKQQYLR